MATIPILYAEVNLLCILFLLLIFAKLKAGTYTQQRQRLFRMVLLANCLLFLLDAVWIFVNSRVLPLGLRANWALNLLYYITSGAVGFFWFLYSEDVQQSPLVSSRRARLLCALPALLLTALALLSMRTGWLFYIDGANVYHRGPLYALQLLCSYGYVVFTAAKARLLSMRAPSYTQKVEYRTLSRFVIAPLAAGAIQVFVPDIATLCVGTTFGALYVFLTMQEQRISADALTGLNNRSKLMQHLSERMARADSRTRMYLVMMDLDCFKSINDGYGHVEGDNALCRTAEALKSCSQDHHHFIARYGGDEFAAVCELEPDEQIETFCGRIDAAMREKSALCPYQLSLSIGWAAYRPDLAGELDFIKLADARLYEAKQARRKNRAAP